MVVICMRNEILKLSDVSIDFKIDGQFYNAVDKVNLTVRENEILAIVGESGCGKSTLATSIMKLHNSKTTKITGEIEFDNKLVNEMVPDELEKIRGSQLAMIFQDPLTALNPLMTVGDQIKETLDLHTALSEKKKKNSVIDLLKKVGIVNPVQTARQYPHELSGGMVQRVVIAIAVACQPRLIIADEPTTALDVTIQAQILDLLKNIQKERHSGIILITHDLGVVAETADTVAVMYAGQVVESGSVEQIFSNPQHPYTQLLLRSIPQIDSKDDKLYAIGGSVPSLKNMITDGCRFAPRMPTCDGVVHENKPKLHEVEPNHYVRCTCYLNFKIGG